MEYLTKTCMNDELAKQISLWNYEGEYEIYNLPSYEEMKEKKYGIVNPERANDYICYLHENKEAVAYASMKKMEDKRIFFGIGLKPDNCGKGMGIYFLKDSLDDIKSKYPESIIYLEVRSWNKRAINSYKKIGFILTNTVTKKDRLGNDSEFIEMELSN